MPHVARDSNQHEPVEELVRRARALESAGEWYEAATLWQQIADRAVHECGEHSREALGAFINLGYALMEAGDLERAANVLYHAWRLEPRIDLKHKRGLYSTLVELLYRANAAPQLIELYTALIPAFEVEGKKGAFDASISRSGLGEMFRREGRFQEAEESLQQAVKDFETIGEPGREGLATAWNNLALVYRDTDRADLGAEACRRSVELCRAGSLPLLPIALDNLVSCLLKRERYAEAEPISLEALAASRLQFPPGQ